MSLHKIRELSYFDYKHKYVELLQQGFTIVPSDISIQAFTDFIGTLGENHKIFIIEKEMPENEEIIIVGSITIWIEPKFIHSMGKVAHIEDLITHESYRGQHIATQLLDHCIEYAKQKACYKIVLNCDKHMERFYERNGFSCKGNEQMAVYF
jgi:glucosamine-phosphate N-acetyltransferase